MDILLWGPHSRSVYEGPGAPPGVGDAELPIHRKSVSRSRDSKACGFIDKHRTNTKQGTVSLPPPINPAGTITATPDLLADSAHAPPPQQQ